MANTQTEKQYDVTFRDVVRFCSKFQRDEETGCDLWAGGRTGPDGYGAFKLGGQKVDAHVLAWVIHNNGAAVPAGQLMMHHCGDKRCVRIHPKHVQLGNHAMNMAFAAANGETAKGERNGQAKLTEDDVYELRNRCLSGEKPSALEEVFGVDRRVIRDAVTGKTWTHLTGSPGPLVCVPAGPASYYVEKHGPIV